ncbi:MAG TPA: LytTR family DNA-binding domain-containing protein [Ruminiclostridium sp.]|nr:LytTR family DNA-binding domain-containing protein [Ruminiclostridium sp.]
MGNVGKADANQNMKVIVIDKERPAAEELTGILSEYEDIEVAGTYTNAQDGFSGIIEKKPEALFLETDMSELDGFSMAKRLMHVNADIFIIFVTESNESAIKAYELNALDCLQKPISKERLDITISRLRHVKGALMINKEKPRRKNHVLKRVPIWKGDRIVVLNPIEIAYFTVKEGEVSVVSNTASYFSKEPLSYWEQKLKEFNFFRCHKSFLVNMERVEEVIPFYNNTYIVRFKGIKDEVAVSRNYIKDFRRLLGI